ncbi:DUF397 domain-containing protein [Sphaerisporangium corydalis]|uniref:DUF397 domain-containing protein n=1 Tax=Sphaerisporangium corydalis TaxID=1441875 RepID=A0ABV9EBF1_9ACTN|nr:DUF397 domain-containing protein [Sphaerisporangium corydalis]
MGARNPAGDLSRAEWRKSSHSNGSGGECVEVAGTIPGVRAVCDSKNASGAVVVVEPGGWAAFLDGLKRGSIPA